MGADAAASLDGRRGLLYGEKRHRQVDVLGFEPVGAGVNPGNAPLGAVVSERLNRSGIRGWRIVGVAVPSGDLEEGEAALLQGLVAGDVVIAGGKAPAAAGAAPVRRPRRTMRILVHRGDRLTALRTVRPRGSRASSGKAAGNRGVTG